MRLNFEVDRARSIGDTMETDNRDGVLPDARGEFGTEDLGQKP